MRGKLLVSAALLLLAFTVVSISLPGQAEDNDGQRLSDLETRVAALEALVLTPASTPASSTRQDDSTSSSSTSSTNSNSSSYAASFSADGDREIEVEIDNAGTYQLIATTTSAFSAVLEGGNGQPIPGFSVETDGTDTVTVSGRLEPGAYILRVSAPSSWNVTIVSLGG